MDKKRGDASETNKKPRLTAKQREEILIENFVNLQRVMTNLSIKFSSLTDQMNKLLGIYEQAAKTIVTGKDEGFKDDKDLLTKIDSLIDQNKTIAKGLVLMEDKLRVRLDEGTENFRSRPLPML